jgi:hypothetical protein
LQSTSAGSHATIDFTNANGSTLAASSLVGGSGAFLDIRNWTHTTLTTDDSSTTNDRLLFASNPGLTAAQLANVQFFNDSGTLVGNGGQIIAYGNMFELVAIPEPSTWFAAGLALLFIGYTQRRKLVPALKRFAALPPG